MDDVDSTRFFIYAQLSFMLNALGGIMWKYLNPVMRRYAGEVSAWIVTGLIVGVALHLFGWWGRTVEWIVMFAACGVVTVFLVERRMYRECLRKAFLDVLERAHSAFVLEEDESLDLAASYRKSSAFREVDTFLKITRDKVRVADLIPRMSDVSWPDSIVHYRRGLKLLQLHLLVDGMNDPRLRLEEMDEFAVKPEYRRAFRLLEHRITEAEQALAQEHHPRSFP